MRKALIPAFLVVLVSVVLGATVLREPIARAATPIASIFVTNDSSHPVPVREQNLDASGNIKVHEQGTAAVSGTVGLSPTANAVKIDPAGNTIATAPTNTQDNWVADQHSFTRMDASLIVVHMEAGTEWVDFRDGATLTLRVLGPNFGNSPSNQTLTLTQPIRMDNWRCLPIGACDASVSVAGSAVQ